jgi:hypothetical protein
MDKEFDKLEAEKRELNLLINNGLSFEIEKTVKKRQKGFLGFFKKRVRETEKMKFTIQEPTLYTLDRLSREQIEFSIDEKDFRLNGVAKVRGLVLDHSRRCARIVAIAVLGNGWEDRTRLQALENLFFKTIKPSKLMDLVRLINTMSNLGDFMNSIRLMSAVRTTMPGRIEETED